MVVWGFECYDVVYKVIITNAKNIPAYKLEGLKNSKLYKIISQLNYRKQNLTDNLFSQASGNIEGELLHYYSKA